MNTSIYMMESNIVYQFCYEDPENYCTSICNNLTEIIRNFYSHFSVTNEFEKIKIVIIHNGFPIVTFRVKYDNGFYFYNTHDCVRMLSLAPQFCSFEMKLAKKISNTKPQSIVKKIEIDPEHPKMIPKKKVKRSLERVIDKSVRNKPIENRPIETKKDIIEFDWQKHKEAEKPAKNKPIEISPVIREPVRNSKLDKFESDKNSFSKIKKDVVNGKLSKDDINPIFILKYEIFEILDTRKCIDFSSNEKLKEEYELFQSFYNECKEEEEEIMGNKNVFVPHNYNYMSPEKKEEYARKYKLTRRQFEDRYVNRSTDDDLIARHMATRSTNSVLNVD